MHCVDVLGREERRLCTLIAWRIYFKDWAGLHSFSHRSVQNEHLSQTDTEFARFWCRSDQHLMSCLIGPSRFGDHKSLTHRPPAMLLLMFFCLGIP
ncbi:hypothetical protein HI914_05644 [Erysiphe necator]|nr:hypothetical protein HI914_05644 [Erysiphe necator]